MYMRIYKYLYISAIIYMHIRIEGSHQAKWPAKLTDIYLDYPAGWPCYSRHSGDWGFGVWHSSMHLVPSGVASCPDTTRQTMISNHYRFSNISCSKYDRERYTATETSWAVIDTRVTKMYENNSWTHILPTFFLQKWPTISTKFNCQGYI